MKILEWVKGCFCENHKFEEEKYREQEKEIEEEKNRVFGRSYDIRQKIDEVLKEVKLRKG